MSKLNRKFLMSIFIILFFVGTLTSYMNSNFIERYFLYKQKQEIRLIGDKIIENNLSFSQANIISAEESKYIRVIKVKNSPDNDLLNVRIKETFYQNGISLDNYWLWENDQEEVVEKGRKIKVYKQEKHEYSLLVEYLLIGEDFVIIAEIVPSFDEALKLMNKITTIILIGAGLLLFLSISILVYKITLPIKKIREATSAISDLDFIKIEINTNDELELLANDINIMSQKLYETHRELIKKNQQMQDLLANVSHDLKTPISLIKMYSHGIKDEIDDGTFLDTIMLQNERMERIVEKLLNLAEIKHMECKFQVLNISQTLLSILDEYSLQVNCKKLKFKVNIDKSIFINLNSEALYLIFSNVISNASKYCLDGDIAIDLYQENLNCVFCITNTVDAKSEIDINKIWDPFYVSQKSRNGNIRGTGLGLSIVKEICEKYDVKYSCVLKNHKISFCFDFKIQI